MRVATIIAATKIELTTKATTTDLDSHLQREQSSLEWSAPSVSQLRHFT